MDAGKSTSDKNNIATPKILSHQRRSPITEPGPTASGSSKVEKTHDTTESEVEIEEVSDEGDNPYVPSDSAESSSESGSDPEEEELSTLVLKPAVAKRVLGKEKRSRPSKQKRKKVSHTVAVNDDGDGDIQTVDIDAPLKSVYLKWCKENDFLSMLPKDTKTRQKKEELPNSG
ncbi:hypothetical protein C8Q76DRAFT_688003 [Earliella scabrosa]|nr:hypothetical protein C8Q76DRAFT_688003 [Earliella scabrosa]